MDSTARISVRIPYDERDSLKRRADKAGFSSISDYIRERLKSDEPSETQLVIRINRLERLLMSALQALDVIQLTNQEMFSFLLKRIPKRNLSKEEVDVLTEENDRIIDFLMKNVASKEADYMRLLTPDLDPLRRSVIDGLLGDEGGEGD